jgi:hypothetical protein
MEDLETFIGSLAGAGVDQLRNIWRQRFGDPPPVRAGDVLRRALAERLQEEALGQDGELKRRLAQMAARHKPGRKPRPVIAAYKAGSRLNREWNGVRHEVDVAEGGFVWNGERHTSLSSIARKITGVRWNGPRFFGLRDEVKP